jgi:hypothetical protein
MINLQHTMREGNAAAGVCKPDLLIVFLANTYIFMQYHSTYMILLSRDSQFTTQQQIIKLIRY